MNERALRMERRLEWPMVIASLLVIPMLVISEEPFSSSVKTVGDVLNWLTWLAFVAEFGLMMWVVDDRKAWIKAHPIEVFVTFATAPVLPSTLAVARVLRLLRVVRLFRIHALRRVLSLQGIRYATLLVFLVVLGGGTAFAGIEGGDVTAWDGVWFATETVTTVGYGDIVPTTSAGRVVAMLIMSVGIGFVALLTAFVADRFIHVGDDSGGDTADGSPEPSLAEIMPSFSGSPSAWIGSSGARAGAALGLSPEIRISGDSALVRLGPVRAVA